VGKIFIATNYTHVRLDIVETLAAKMRWGVRCVCERVRRGLWGSLAVLWPLAPRGHAPLRSLAEGSFFVCCGSSVAARHRGAEEEILL
jgi:hypothetical protein